MKIYVIILLWLIAGCSRSGTQTGDYSVGPTSGSGTTLFSEGIKVYVIDGHKLNADSTIIDPQLPLLGIILTFDPSRVSDRSYSINDGITTDGSLSTIRVNHVKHVADIQWDRERGKLTHKNSKWNFSEGMVLHVHQDLQGIVVISELDYRRGNVSDPDELIELSRKLKNPK